MAMIKKLLFTLFLCMLFGGALFAQSTIKGVVKDPSGTPVPFLQVLLKQDDKVINGAYTDDLGAYQIFGVSAGTYDISAGGAFNCPNPLTLKGIYVPSSEVKFVDLTIDCSSTELGEVEIIWVPPVFSQDNTTSSTKLTGDEVRKTPGRSISQVLSVIGGVASVDGSVASVRGNRSDGQQTIIDGVRVRGTGGVPMQSIEGFELIQGGIPAEYGDGTSFTVLTTRGVAKDYQGGVELRSSIEGYTQTLAAVNVSGPILKGKTPQDPARMGFLISAEGNYDLDGYPARGGTWVAKPEVIQDILANPIEFQYYAGTYIPYQRANELGSDAFKKIRVRQNAQDWGFVAQGKIDIMGGGKDARGKSKNNLRFSLGGSYEYRSGLGWGHTSALFNSINNSVSTNNTLRVNARLNHRVKTDTAANAILKNIMYDINVNYTLYNYKTQDRIHKDNIFDYGYLGKFSTERRNYYEDDMMEIQINELGDSARGLVPKIIAYQVVDWVTFEKDAYKNNGNYYNPDLLPYISNFVDFIKEKTGVDINNASFEDRRLVMQTLGGSLNYLLYGFYGLLNGETPYAVGNGLYAPPGVGNGSYSKGRRDAIGAKASLSLNLKDHEVKFGFEFEKLTDRSYGISARYLWTLMRSLTYDETAYFAFDFANPKWISGNLYPRFDEEGYLQDTVVYDIISNLSNFDQNLRKELGITDNTTLLDIDSYDPKFFAQKGLSLFSNYELLNLGSSVVAYNGYDYTGKLSNKKLNLDNFFSGGDMHAQGKYAIGAFEPIYLAFFLQDKFAISNLLFNLGLRLDYFNANQYVLRDPFLLRPAHTVQDLKDAKWNTIEIDNWGADWIPYVATADLDINTEQPIVAYRNGKTWYNHLGQEVADPTTYLGTGGPVLREEPEPDAVSKVTAGAFKRYKPDVKLMPRISFSFPVSTNSLFYAHYNIITYRPTNLQLNPVAYLFISENRTSLISNPNLRAQRTVDYEIGFRQAVGENSAINIAAFYSEKRDQIQSYRYTGAYPNTYYSFENQDFGTVQGYMLEFTMRGTKNLSFRANYTLQFAKGTGSTATSNSAIIASGQPNLRTLTNLEYDQRHSIAANVDFRFSQGTNYNGPVTVKQKKGTDTKKEIRWLENAGANLSVTASSGMPYSRSGIVYSELGWGQRTNPQLKGTINGANMPWIFTCNLRLDKTFVLNLANKKNNNESGKRKNKPGILTVYLEFLNLLNLKNVISVYQYTGSPDDDGYLSSSLFKNVVSNGLAFNLPVNSAMNYYQMLIANPYNYNQPFRVYLGVQFSF